MKDPIRTLSRYPEWKDQAARWFHQKWGIPLAAYLESMDHCLEGTTLVFVTQKETIIAGLGVIENDFHPRKDLAPNICAVFVEPEYRGRGIAGELLNFACRDMKDRGIGTLYLVTDHVGFYERYGWRFLCMVRGDGEDRDSRIYLHREE
ncbi:MAG: GNAT family N-acetyltransferase [Angelakisella sp.]|jgi:GNAT superfamily N-acetyltransferase|nr:GNAT family N-acetyltransferase [Angelakisella sp.]